MIKRPKLKLRRKYSHQDNDETAEGNTFRFLNRSEEILSIPDYWKKSQAEDVASKRHYFGDRWQSAIHHQIRQEGKQPDGTLLLTRDKSKNVDRRTSIHITGREWIAPGGQAGLENIMVTSHP